MYVSIIWVIFHEMMYIFIPYFLILSRYNYFNKLVDSTLIVKTHVIRFHLEKNLHFIRDIV